MVECPDHSKLVLEGVVGMKVEILICVSGFSIYGDFDGSIGFDGGECVKES